MVTEQQIKRARDKFKEISGITIYTPDEGSLDDFEQSRYEGLVAALEAALSAAKPQPAPSVAVKQLQWDEDGDNLKARMGDREWMLNITPDGKTWAGSTRPFVFGRNLTWSSVPNCSMVSLEAAKAACQADCQARYTALTAQVQDVATARDALQAIANLPTGFNIDVCRGHEEAYRAVETLFSTPPSVQVQDAAKPDDELFWRLRVAYLRGAEWRDTTGSMHLVDKASYDYADKITSPLAAAPAKQEGGHE